MTYANNIQHARSPLTGMTIAEVAAVKRHLGTKQGQRQAQAFQEYWAAVEPANEGTLTDWNRTSLEAGWVLDKLAAKYK